MPALSPRGAINGLAAVCCALYVASHGTAIGLSPGRIVAAEFTYLLVAALIFRSGRVIIQWPPP
ncbi:hypothetical protein BH23CHL7_BH23CHL7_20010 [soil metagenome]